MSSAALPLPRLVSSDLEDASSLAELAPGDHAVVHRVDPSSAMSRRLIELGFRPGTPVHVVRRAPLGDPISYELRGSRFCLRRSEARLISVVRASGE